MGNRDAALAGHSHSLWAQPDVLGLFLLSVGSWPLLVMWFDAAIWVYIDVTNVLAQARMAISALSTYWCQCHKEIQS